MKNYNLERVIYNHNTADAFISLFFAGVDILLYLIILVLFGCEKNFFKVNQKLSLLILLDTFFRIINLYITSFTYSLTKEIFFTTLGSFQFYLIVTFLNHIFTQINTVDILESGEIKYPLLSTTFFFILSIIFNFSKVLSLIQYVIAILAVFIYSYHVGGKVDLFIANIKKKNPYFSGQNFINHFIMFIAFYYMVYFILRIFNLFIEDKLYYSYMEMACEIFKEVAKYLCFGIVIALYHLFNKYIKDDDYVMIV